jgi:hypothetical protein
MAVNAVSPSTTACSVRQTIHTNTINDATAATTTTDGPPTTHQRRQFSQERRILIPKRTQVWGGLGTVRSGGIKLQPNSCRSQLKLP